jgi:hypothetical protein
MKFGNWLNEAAKRGSKSFGAAVDKREKQKQAFKAKVQKQIEKMGGNPGKIDWDTVDHGWFNDMDVRTTAKNAMKK